MKHALHAARRGAGLLRTLRRPPVARMVAWLLLVALLPMPIACQNYYRTRGKEVSAPVLTTLASSKMFLLHQGNLTWQLINPRLEGQTLVGLKGEVTGGLSQYDQAPNGQNSQRYLLRDKQAVMNLVHVYITEYEQGEGQQIGVPLSAIQRIDLVEPDTGRTTGSYLLGGAAIGVGVFVLIYLIVLALKTSCPFVYAYDGRQYHFVGEAYGGAIFQPLERNDYMPLPEIRPVQNQYQLKITNELKERQFTNLAELWVVAHAPNTQVLLDQRGGVHTLTAPHSPSRVVSAGGQDCAPQLQAPDRNVFFFNEELDETTANSLTLTFERPAQTRAAKLVLRAQNSLWLDYLYGEFARKFGSRYNEWALKQKTVPAAKINQWLLDQQLLLKVYVETTHGWQLTETIPTVGPLAARDLLVPLDLTDVAAGPVRVRLEAGFMFWEVDYAALDCSPELPVTLEKCRPQSALDENGVDQRDNLATDDSLYLQQLRPGMEVTLRYQTKLAAPAAQTQRTVFLRTKGYYEHIRQYEGLPNLPELYAFRKPGRFVEFSKERYHETTRQLALTALQP